MSEYFVDRVGVCPKRRASAYQAAPTSGLNNRPVPSQTIVQSPLSAKWRQPASGHDDRRHEDGLATLRDDPGFMPGD